MTSLNFLITVLLIFVTIVSFGFLFKAIHFDISSPCPWPWDPSPWALLPLCLLTSLDALDRFERLSRSVTLFECLPCITRRGDRSFEDDVTVTEMIYQKTYVVTMLYNIRVNILTQDPRFTLRSASAVSWPDVVKGDKTRVGLRSITL